MAKTLQKLMIACCAIVLLLTIAFYGLNYYWALGKPYSSNYEGCIIWDTLRLSQLHNIYSAAAFKSCPWGAVIQPPVFLGLGAAMLKIFGASFWPLRMISMVSSIAFSILAYRLFAITTNSKVAALIGLTVLLNFTIISRVSWEASPNILGAALGLLVLERFCHWRVQEQSGSRNSKYIIWVALLAGLACMTKQQTLPMVLAIPCYLLADKDWRAALRFMIVWPLTICAALGVMQLITHGGFLEVYTLVVKIPPTIAELNGHLSELGQDWFKVFFALGIMPIYLLRNKLDGLTRLAVFLFAIAFVITCYTLAFPYTGPNSAIAFLVSIAWLISVSLSRLNVLAAVPILALCVLNLGTISEFGRFYHQLKPHADESAAFLQKAGLEGQLVLSDDPNLEILSGARPAVVDVCVMILYWKNHPDKWQEFLDSISKKRFAAIMINNVDSQSGGDTVFWPKEAVARIKENYVCTKILSCSSWNVAFYLPKGSKAEQNADGPLK